MSPKPQPAQSSSDLNAGSIVLFRRGIAPDGSACGAWEVGYVEWTFFTDAAGRVVEPDFEVDALPWVSIIPAAPEGPMAPVRLSVPLDDEHIDVIRHRSELPSG